MEIKLNETIYEKSLDKNIIYQYDLRRQEIHIDKLEDDIINLQINIDHTTQIKTTPKGASIDVKEAIDYWNDMNGFDTDDLIKDKEEKEVLLNKIKSITEVKKTWL